MVYTSPDTRRAFYREAAHRATTMCAKVNDAGRKFCRAGVRLASARLLAAAELDNGAGQGRRRRRAVSSRGVEVIARGPLLVRGKRVRAEEEIGVAKARGALFASPSWTAINNSAAVSLRSIVQRPHLSARTGCCETRVNGAWTGF
jgi:hypothetical protein